MHFSATTIAAAAVFFVAASALPEPQTGLKPICTNLKTENKGCVRCMSFAKGCLPVIGL